MSYPNPYEVPTNPTHAGEFRPTSVRPIELYRRAFELMGDQYWIFFVITFLMVFIGSLVPFGILYGPLLVGVFMCFMDRENGRQTEIGTLFRGFDRFLDSFLAMILIAVFVTIVLIPMMVLIIAGSIFVDQNNVGGVGIVLLLFGVFIFTVVMFLLYVPFVFVFQLIADRQCTAMQAIQMSWKASWANSMGILWFVLVNGAFSLITALLCYIPLFFFLPISMGALFVLYRDVFPRIPVQAPQY